MTPCNFKEQALRYYLYTFFILAALVTSCGLADDENAGDVVARSGSHYLYKADIQKIVPPNSSPEDSANVVTIFVENWIRQMVVLAKAESNLTDEQKNFDSKLQEYKQSLILYAYEQELIRQRLDTLVSDIAINDFYEKNQTSFELKDNIIKVIYLKVPNKAPKLEKAKQWYKSNTDKDKQELEQYAHQYAMNYYFDEDSWLLFDDLLKEVPISMYDKEQFLRNNRYIELSDSLVTYLVNIKGFKTKSSISPLSFEKENIRQMILNQRKLKLLKEMEQSAYEEALKKGLVEIYKK